MSHDHQGHDRHSGRSVAMFRDKYYTWTTLSSSGPELASQAMA
jgi:hypothetical protein